MIVLLTGGTGGIGQPLLRGLVEAGARVILACRDADRGAQAIATLGARGAGQVQVERLDLASLASVRDLVLWAERALPRLDVLINAAGVWSRQRRATVDGLELTFGVNHVAHQALTVGLLPVLAKAPAPRVVTVASGLHLRGKIAWDDLMQAEGGFNGTKAYEQSKLANVMFALALARKHRGAVASTALHPGIVKTALTREYPEIHRDTPARSIVTPVVAARAVLRLALDPALAKLTGRYLDRDREVAPSKAAQSVPDQDRLWRLTDELIAARLAAHDRGGR